MSKKTEVDYNNQSGQADPETTSVKNREFTTTLDSILLAGFAREHIKAPVLDLGTGNGIIPNLIAVSINNGSIVGIDINRKSISRARNNTQQLTIQNRIQYLAADIKTVPNLFKQNSFESVMVNPPYRKQGTGRISPYPERAVSCHEITCDLDDVLKAASHVLKYKGRFFLIYLPDRLPELLYRLELYRLFPKTMQMVHPFKDKSCRHVLICARKDVSPGMETKAPLIVYSRHREYTDQMNCYFSYLPEFQNKKNGGN